MARYPRKSGGFVRKVRIFLMLVVLVAVAGDAWLKQLRTTDWDRSLWVAVYPINADGSRQAASYINSLDDSSFEVIERFLASEAARYGVRQSEPVNIHLGPQVYGLPPVPPEDGHPLKVMWWSLKMRWWAWQNQRDYGDLPADIVIFVKYYDPNRHEVLDHSVGLQKGLLGVVNAYASRQMAGRNKMIIAHELLHTVGATDKYDMDTLQPTYPEGFAEPQREPRYPQLKAEIMGGRIPLSPRRAEIPRSLKKVVIGETTAREIKWID